jgi:predicted nuclease with RNAse H fold
MEHYIGVDYGSKLAGTTVICHYSNDQLYCHRSLKKKDADQFILEFVSANSIRTVYLDAPLSLPSALLGKGDNYFYRAGDKVLGAMSPMFLGGLTARAIALKDKLSKLGVTCHEVYPGGHVREVFGPESYSKKDKTLINPFYQRLKTEIDLPTVDCPDNWHAIDSMLCWLIGQRHEAGAARSVGDPHEGIILI